MSVFSSVKILKNLQVLGTTTTINSENVNITDRYTYNNNGYTLLDHVSGGIIFNNKAIHVDNSFDGTVTALSGTTITITNTVGLIAGDYIQLSGFADPANEGIYLVSAADPVNDVITINVVADGLHLTSIANVADANVNNGAVVHKVEITYLETIVDGTMTVNNGDNINNMTTTNIVNGFLKLAGDENGQEASGGINKGGLILNGNVNKDTNIADGSIQSILDNVIFVTDVTGLVVNDTIRITGTTANNGFYTVNSINAGNNSITVSGDPFIDQFVEGGVSKLPQQMGYGGILNIDFNNTITVADASNLEVGQTVFLRDISDEGYHRVTSINSNTFTVDGYVTDQQGDGINPFGNAIITSNTDVVTIDGTGNPTRDDSSAALYVRDSTLSNFRGGLTVQGNVLLKPDSKLYTKYITGSTKVNDDIAVEADATTVEFLNAYPVHSLARIRKITYDAAGGPKNLAQPFNSIYLYNHLSGVVTVNLPNPDNNDSTERPIDGMELTIMLMGGAGTTVVINAQGTNGPLNVGFDNDSNITSLTLFNLGEKVTLIYSATLKTWLIM